MQTPKPLIGQGRYPGWYESSLGGGCTEVILSVLSCCCSYDMGHVMRKPVFGWLVVSRYNFNWPVQLQKLASVWEFPICADLDLCCPHISHNTRKPVYAICKQQRSARAVWSAPFVVCWLDRIIMSPTKGEVDILFLVRILLASAIVSAWHFLVCTISREPVGGF